MVLCMYGTHTLQQLQCKQQPGYQELSHMQGQSEGTVWLKGQRESSENLSSQRMALVSGSGTVTRHALSDPQNPVSGYKPPMC